MKVSKYMKISVDLMPPLSKERHNRRFDFIQNGHCSGGGHSDKENINLILEPSASLG